MLKELQPARSKLRSNAATRSDLTVLPYCLAFIKVKRLVCVLEMHPSEPAVYLKPRITREANYTRKFTETVGDRWGLRLHALQSADEGRLRSR